MGTSSTRANIQSFRSFGENKNVVLCLTSELNPKKYKIFFDKLFASLELLNQTKLMDIYAIGTLSEDLTRGCPLTTGSAMGKDGCGTMSQFVKKKAGLLSVLGSITEELNPYSIFLVKIHFQANRFDCRNSKIIQVPHPASVVIYNCFMGGVDKADMLLSLYCSKMRSRK